MALVGPDNNLMLRFKRDISAQLYESGKPE